jgi:hypothetical protein
MAAGVTAHEPGLTAARPPAWPEVTERRLVRIRGHTQNGRGLVFEGMQWVCYLRRFARWCRHLTEASRGDCAIQGLFGGISAAVAPRRSCCPLMCEIWAFRYFWPLGAAIGNTTGARIWLNASR